jgi:class 3 adenylate cyclase/pimeloyl-ACP methyl ester carboxylesterase
VAAEPIRYASSGDAQIAYRISDGDGPVLVALSGGVADLLAREHPMTLDYYEQVEAFAKLVLLDPRGTGRSDPVSSAGLTTEVAVADLLAVIDAAGFERVALWGYHSGGLTAMAFAAEHPDRVERLILTNTWARALTDDDQPWGISADFSDWLIEEHSRRIGEGALFADAFAPSRAGDPNVAQWFADIEAGLARTQAVALTRWSQETDVRSLLSQISAPTLVVHAARNQAVPVEHARYLASHIPRATLVEIDGIDHAFPVSEIRNAFLDEIEQFITGAPPRRKPDRVFATVLFTDIVGSTERVREMGDGQWRHVLADHDRVTCEVIDRHGGELIKSTGDGVLARFDSPSRAVRAGLQLVQDLGASLTPVRVGVHAGEVEQRGDDIAGLAVHLAQRVCGQAAPGEVWVSRGLPDLVLGAGLAFADRGEHQLKGLDEPMHLWSVT